MTKPKVESRIENVATYTTAKGGSYIKVFDLIRSNKGREIVDAHAAIPVTEESLGVENGKSKTSGRIVKAP